MEKQKILLGKPYLEVISGPMFSGKSQELERRLGNIHHYNNHRRDNFGGTDIVDYVILRPTTDSRPSNVRKLPYDHRNWEYCSPDNLDVDRLISLYDYIILDEAQFFYKSVIEDVSKLLHSRKYVIVSGLDKDYRGEPFSEFMKWTLSVSDEVTKLTAICSECGSPSTMARLLSVEPSNIDVSINNIIIEDENHKFIPVCRSCMYESYSYNEISNNKTYV